MTALLHYMYVIIFTVITVMIQFQNTLWTIPLLTQKHLHQKVCHTALCLLFIVPQIN